KAKLERAMAIREFASHELALPDNRSYRNYSEVGRRFVLWNVFATPELSLDARQWFFPVAGCVNYRGYFDEAAAKAAAEQFASSGDDVHIGGVRSEERRVGKEWRTGGWPGHCRRRQVV